MLTHSMDVLWWKVARNHQSRAFRYEFVIPFSVLSFPCGALISCSVPPAAPAGIKLQEQVLKSELCQHRVTYFFGVKCRSYGEAGNLGAGVPSANHS